MRLSAVERGQPLKQRLILALIGRTQGEAPDILRALWHRSEFFGRPLGAITQRAMREPGDWSIAERELFAAHVSTRNSCAFCIACHSEYASQAGDRGEVEHALSQGTADSPRIDAALAFLAAFAEGPEAINRGQVECLRAAGVGEAAIRDLAYIGFAFCIINRVADALDFKVMSREQFARSWPAMRDRGYRV